MLSEIPHRLENYRRSLPHQEKSRPLHGATLTWYYYASLSKMSAPGRHILVHPFCSLKKISVGTLSGWLGETYARTLDALHRTRVGASAELFNQSNI
jgi:hypothetical protein